MRTRILISAGAVAVALVAYAFSAGSRVEAELDTFYASGRSELRVAALFPGDWQLVCAASQYLGPSESDLEPGVHDALRRESWLFEPDDAWKLFVFKDEKSAPQVHSFGSHRLPFIYGGYLAKRTPGLAAPGKFVACTTSKGAVLTKVSPDPKSKRLVLALKEPS